MPTSLDEVKAKAEALVVNIKKSSTTLKEQPKIVQNCSLYDYQLEGVNWLISLYENNLNGILGDDMGLGKTLQSLTMVGYLFDVKKIKGPFLIIAPLSTIGNWDSEIKRFLPTLTVERYIGTKQERENKRSKIVEHIMKQPKEQRKKNPTPPFEILLTTYELIIKDILFLKKFNWAYMIVDEAHRLKNPNSTLVKVKK